MLIAYIDPATGYVLGGTAAWLIGLLMGALGVAAVFSKKMFRFIKRHWRPLLGCLVLIGGIWFIVANMTMADNESPLQRRIIVLGFDGLSPEIVEPMMAQGELPGFAALKQQGGYRRLQTTNPPQSPVAWSSIATGRNAGHHGVYDFIVRDPKDYSLRLSLSRIEQEKPQRVLRAKAFWQYASDKNVPSVLLSHPITFPPDQINGRMLSGMGVPDILGTEGTFSFYTTEPEKKEKVTGGNVFHLNRAPLMVIHLNGPKVRKTGGNSKNTTVPVQVTLQPGNSGVALKFQDQVFELKTGEWSEFKEITFTLGWPKKMAGIVQFYLVETEPEFKLYVSPINFHPKDPYFQISHPKDYSKELAEQIGLYHTAGMPLDTWALNEERLDEAAFISQVNAVSEERQQMLQYELNQTHSGILFAYFESPDIIQHMFWRYTDPENPIYEKDAPSEYVNMIKNWYKKFDRILTNTVQSLNSDDVLIVLSDHGMAPFRRAVHVNAWLRKHGYLELNDPNAPDGDELLRDINWQETSAYAIGFGAIYLNMAGREQHGIINAGAEAEALKAELTSKLTEWIDLKTSERVLHRVYTREEIWSGEYLKETPDLYLGFNRGYRASWQTAIGGVPAELIEDNLKKWSGDHLIDPSFVPGVLFSNKPITKESPSLFDITPTLLKLIGYSEQELSELQFDGTPFN